jgi:hypothetical protein
MNRRTFALSLPAFAATLSAALPAWAHHGWSSFDESKPIYLAGKVKSTKWQNPHAEIVITLTADTKLPADLGKRKAPAQTATVDGEKILSGATTPSKLGDWTLELAPMTRIEAWKVKKPNVGDQVSAVGFTFKDGKGEALARIEYLMIGDDIYGLRSMPAS